MLYLSTLTTNTSRIQYRSNKVEWLNDPPPLVVDIYNVQLKIEWGHIVIFILKQYFMLCLLAQRIKTGIGFYSHSSVKKEPDEGQPSIPSKLIFWKGKGKQEWKQKIQNESVIYLIFFDSSALTTEVYLRPYRQC